ncbi:MAG: hypothetical protein FJW66_01175 [Actinobacteria bacterium]|nr:hypothetical protein [Actinomycetota bacterium]
MDLSKIIDGKKFMWDGSSITDKKSADDIEKKYKGDGFETVIHEEDNNYYVFTRRIVKEVVVEGQPTI